MTRRTTLANMFLLDAVGEKAFDRIQKKRRKNKAVVRKDDEDKCPSCLPIEETKNRKD